LSPAASAAGAGPTRVGAPSGSVTTIEENGTLAGPLLVTLIVKVTWSPLVAVAAEADLVIARSALQFTGGLSTSSWCSFCASSWVWAPAEVLFEESAWSAASSSFTGGQGGQTACSCSSMASSSSFLASSALT